MARSSQRSLGLPAAVAVIALWLTCISAWVTHVVVCIKASAWVLLLFGCIVAPVGVIHGIGVWLGAF
ncbi:hypothetical protein FHR71_005458 [Methylobacterium sp. RAS18]|nr:hypothetical protein [Methylobacterium sp. RAS18]